LNRGNGDYNEKISALKDVLGLIDEEYKYWISLKPSPQNIELLRRIRNRLKVKINGD